jgi:hypothetical protein
MRVCIISTLFPFDLLPLRFQEAGEGEGDQKAADASANDQVKTEKEGGDEGDEAGLSRAKKKKASRMSVAQLKQVHPSVMLLYRTWNASRSNASVRFGVLVTCVCLCM